MLNGLFMDSVEQAVSLSMKNDKVLVVYNSSGDDQWLNAWFKAEIAGHLKAVWLKLLKGTEQFNFFEQIFPSVVVPSLYLVKQGQIISIIQGDDCHSDGESHWAKLERFIGTSDSVNSVSSSISAPRTFKEQVIETTQQKYHEELIKQRRIAQEERTRILRLVEADRAERKARNRPTAVEGAENRMQIHDHIKHVTGLRSNSCILLIRLTNGDSVTNQFNSNCNLNDVRTWVDANRTDGDCPYSFHRSIPRVTFNESDELKTLAALELLPRSALILRPLENAYNNLNVAEAKGPGLLGKVFSGLSTWWSSDDVNERRDSNISENLKNETNETRLHDTAVNDDSSSKKTITAILSEGSNMESPISSQHVSPVQPPCDPHSNPSELSLPSRCVTPNVYQFVNKDDEEKERSTYNGNNVNLEKKKDE